MNIEEIELQRLNYVLQQILDKELMADIEIYKDEPMNWYIAQIRGYVWSEQIDVIDIEYPLDWWQAFKERWFPDWAIEKWPVEYKTHHIDFRSTFPKLLQKYPNEWRPVVFKVLHNEGIDVHDTR